MKKSAFITIGACALASLAVIKMKHGLRSVKHVQRMLTPRLSSDANAGMFV